MPTARQHRGPDSTDREVQAFRAVDLRVAPLSRSETGPASGLRRERSGAPPPTGRLLCGQTSRLVRRRGRDRSAPKPIVSAGGAVASASRPLRGSAARVARRSLFAQRGHLPAVTASAAPCVNPQPLQLRYGKPAPSPGAPCRPLRSAEITYVSSDGPSSRHTPTAAFGPPRARPTTATSSRPTCA